MKTNDDLIQHLITTNRLKSNRLIQAFQDIDREKFVLPEFKEYAYLDNPLGIGESQTISQPTTVAIMLESLDIREGHNILDIGSGSGWTTALCGVLVGKEGSVVGVERVSSLVAQGRLNIQQFPELPINIEQATDSVGKPGKVFDRILVSAAATDVPEILLTQLKTGGRLVIPINNEIQIIDRIDEDSFKTQSLYGFRFVPLIL